MMLNKYKIELIFGSLSIVARLRDWTWFERTKRILMHVRWKIPIELNIPVPYLIYDVILVGSWRNVSAIFRVFVRCHSIHSISFSYGFLLDWLWISFIENVQYKAVRIIRCEIWTMEPTDKLWAISNEIELIKLWAGKLHTLIRCLV